MSRTIPRTAPKRAPLYDPQQPNGGEIGRTPQMWSTGEPISSRDLAEHADASEAFQLPPGLATLYG